MDDRPKSLRRYLASELNRVDTDLRKYSDRLIELKRRQRDIEKAIGAINEGRSGSR